LRNKNRKTFKKILTNAPLGRILDGKLNMPIKLRKRVANVLKIGKNSKIESKKDVKKNKLDPISTEVLILLFLVA